VHGLEINIGEAGRDSSQKPSESSKKALADENFEQKDGAYFFGLSENILRYYGEFGPWGGTTADGSPLLVRDVGIEEMYSLDLQLP
jgi:hypothetical protein